MRDYLKALPDNFLDQVGQPNMDARQLCDLRQKMWEQAEALRRSSNKMQTALTAAYNLLGGDEQDLPALKLLLDVKNFVKDNPIPAQPSDCAVGKCLPLVHTADVELKRWMDRLYQHMAQSLDARLTDVGTRIRGTEVILRGELSLGGETRVADLPKLFAPLWSCGKKPACVFPLQIATKWLILN
ncbi:hypothetical protein [Pseudorhodobacter sp.]|uniref:hypothetical protein n=1 Tax=Pseudorhodobacter sp. TaxID=1934400 RepID=UPI0026474244|nr:hypothetical protein [Pseudorhodobacter sp.]MDN5786980.1 hypothetical protein [Pseudorhodobacter sp.]